MGRGQHGGARKSSLKLSYGQRWIFMSFRLIALLAIFFVLLTQLVFPSKRAVIEITNRALSRPAQDRGYSAAGPQKTEPPKLNPVEKTQPTQTGDKISPGQFSVAQQYVDQQNNNHSERTGKTTPNENAQTLPVYNTPGTELDVSITFNSYQGSGTNQDKGNLSASQQQVSNNQFGDSKREQPPDNEQLDQQKNQYSDEIIEDVEAQPPQDIPYDVDEEAKTPSAYSETADTVMHRQGMAPNGTATQIDEDGDGFDAYGVPFKVNDKEPLAFDVHDWASHTPSTDYCCWNEKVQGELTIDTSLQPWLPNLLIIGAQKAATSQVNRLLRLDERVHVSYCRSNGCLPTKETHFLNIPGITSNHVAQYAMSFQSPRLAARKVPMCGGDCDSFASGMWDAGLMGVGDTVLRNMKPNYGFDQCSMCPLPKRWIWAVKRQYKARRLLPGLEFRSKRGLLNENNQSGGVSSMVQHGLNDKREAGYPKDPDTSPSADTLIIRPERTVGKAGKGAIKPAQCSRASNSKAAAIDMSCAANCPEKHPLQGLRMDATPDYLIRPFVACRVASFMPRANVVILLRDPVDRAFSQFHMQYTTEKPIPKPFSVQVRNEMEMLHRKRCAFGAGSNPLPPTHPSQKKPLMRSLWECFGCYDQPQKNQSFCWSHINATIDRPDLNPGMRTGMLLRGMYGPQVAWWASFIPKEQLHVINFQDVAKNEVGVTTQLAKKLGFNIDIADKADTVEDHVFRYREMPDDVVEDTESVRHELEDFFAPLNRQLYQLLQSLGIDFTPFDNKYDFRK